MQSPRLVGWVALHAVGGELLDVGPDQSIHGLLELRSDVHATALRREPAEPTSGAPDRAVIVNWDGAELPFEDQRFSTVLVRDGFDHRLAPRRILAEAQRVLRVGGIILIATRYGRHGHQDHEDAFYLAPFLQELRDDLVPVDIEFEDGWLMIALRPGRTDTDGTRALQIAERHLRGLEDALDSTSHGRTTAEQEADRWRAAWENARARGDRYKARWDHLRRNPAVRAARAARHPLRLVRRLARRR